MEDKETLRNEIILCYPVSERRLLSISSTKALQTIRGNPSATMPHLIHSNNNKDGIFCFCRDALMYGEVPWMFGFTYLQQWWNSMVARNTNQSPSLIFDQDYSWFSRPLLVGLVYSCISKLLVPWMHCGGHQGVVIGIQILNCETIDKNPPTAWYENYFKKVSATSTMKREIRERMRCFRGEECAASDHALRLIRDFVAITRPTPQSIDRRCHVRVNRMN